MIDGTSSPDLQAAAVELERLRDAFQEAQQRFDMLHAQEAAKTAPGQRLDPSEVVRWLRENQSPQEPDIRGLAPAPIAGG